MQRRAWETVKVVLESDEGDIVGVDIEAVECIVSNQVLLHSSRQAGSIVQEKGEKNLVAQVTAVQKPAVGPADRDGVYSRVS